MRIRKYNESDYSELIKFWKDVFPNEPLHNEASKVLGAKLAVDDLIFVAEEDEQLIGSCMAGYDGHRGWLYSVGVAESSRRRSVGTKLVEYALAALKGIGCIKVNLQIRSTNVEVASFYKSLGFSIEERLSMGILIEQNA